MYRVGDIVQSGGGGKNPRFLEDRLTILEDEKYNNTVLQYYLLHKRHELDWEILWEACDVLQPEMMGNGEVAVHLRLGDRIGFQYSTILKCVKRFTTKFEVDTVRLLYVLHYGANKKNGKYFPTVRTVTKSNTHITIIQKGLENLNISSLHSENTTVDEDLCRLMGARAVCLSHGGFDMVVGRFVFVVCIGGVVFLLILLLLLFVQRPR